MLSSFSLRGGFILALSTGYSYAELTPCNAAQFAGPAYTITGFHQLRAVDYRGTLETSTGFTITDTVNGYTTLCQEYGRGFKGQIGGDARTCFLDENNATTGGRENIRFVYEAESGQLTFERNWICNQADGTFGALWSASASTTTNSTSECMSIPGSAADVLHGYKGFVNCTLPENSFSPVRVKFKRPVKKPNANAATWKSSINRTQTSPPATNDSPCFGRSFTYPNWIISNLSKSGVVVESRATGKATACPADRDGWTVCDDPDTHVLVERTGGRDIYVAGNQTWECGRGDSGLHLLVLSR